MIGTSNDWKKTNLEKQVIKYLDKLKVAATSSHPRKKLKEWRDYYSGEFFDSKNRNYFNMIKPIIDTKLTAILDAKISTQVVPKYMSFQDFDQIDSIDGIADILQDCVDSIKYRINLIR